MKQVLQHLRSGEMEVADVPCPMVRPGHLLVQTARSLISAGTERMLVEFGQASLLAKARAQPDKVKQVLDKIKTDGLLPTLEAVFSRLDEPLPLGYCNAGRVVEVGAGVSGFQLGDRVASNGPHAEMVCVPTTMAARIPDGVSDEEASFTVLSSIALNGVRLLAPTLGERVVVFGLGLLGIVGAQFLRAHGCAVLGVDVNSARCALARQFGCEAISVSEGADPVEAATAFSRGHGVDAVLVTAAAKNDDIMHQAAQMCRKKGRLVLVGSVDLNLRRADFYEKELSFQVSCAYGPGRYDPSYEGKNRDYPRPYVRWTVARNFEAVLDTVASGQVDLKPLISRRIAQADAANAYDAILKDRSVMGVVLEYPEQAPPTDRVVTIPRSASGAAAAGEPVVGVIGAGNFTKLALLPMIRKAGARVKMIASAGGLTGMHAARKFEAGATTSDHRTLLADPEINVVFITTRHASHPKLVVEALEAGKHVFVEKPLAIEMSGLQLVRAAREQRPDLHVMVGFNRRFAPHAVQARELLAGRSQPIAVNLMVNAGAIPADHWVQDPEVGGDRIVGEGCHFIELAMYLVGRPITHIQAVMFGPQAGGVLEDKMSINMSFADGSIATVHYWANGPKAYPKERVEVFSEGRVLVIDNWCRLGSYNWPSAPKMRMRQDKGHRAQVAQCLDRIRTGGEPLIPFEQIDLVTVASFEAVRAAREHVTVALSCRD